VGRIVNLTLLISFFVLASGCATSFTGSAKVKGPKQCHSICNNWNMDLAGMVAMGDYTDGCICVVPDKKISKEDAVTGAVSASGGAVGVIRQMEEAARQQQQARH